MRKTTTLDNLFKKFSTGLSVATLNSIRLLSKISAKITVARIDKNMTQTQFAEYMDVSQGMISKWESGDYNFTIKQLCEICEKLELTPDVEFEPLNAMPEYEPQEKYLTLLNPCKVYGQDISKINQIGAA